MKLAAVALIPCALSLTGCLVEVQDDPHGTHWPEQSGERRTPGGPGRVGDRCATNEQCGLGCFCNADSRCQFSGYCRVDSECAAGFRCDDRRTCVPRTPIARDGGWVKTDAGAVISDARRPDAGVPSGDAGTPASDAGTPSAPAEPLCRIDAQCGQGGKCVNGQCQRACTADTQCGTGQVCRESRCQPNTTTGGQCVFSSDCAGGACINGSCHRACGQDSDCPNRADRCDRGLCRPDGRPIPQCTANAQCPDSRICVDAICRTPCSTDANCGPNCSGTICHAGFCVMPEELAPPPKMCGTSCR